MLTITSIKDDIKGFCTFEMYEKVEEAKRNFETLCKTSPELKIHKEQYGLYKLGTYDKLTGVIKPCKPELIIAAKDYVD